MSAVLLGIGAIAADVSSWTVERAQTQNGADAGALATAESCARGTCDLTVANLKYSTTNSNQTLTNGEAVMSGYPCGSAPNSAVALPACAVSQPADCPPNLAGTNWVTVRTMTSSSVSPIFGKALDSTDNGKTVVSCSQALWGTAGTGGGLSMTISLCEWQNAIGQLGGSTQTFAPAPPYATWPPAGVTPYGNRTPPAPGAAGGEQVLVFHSGSGAGTSECNQHPAGWDLPGGFGNLDDPNNNCTTVVTANNTYGAAPGTSIDPACGPLLQAAITNHTVLYMPVYDGANSNGQNGQYHLAGFAAFVPTGGHLVGSGGFNTSSTLVSSGGNYCTGNNKCLYGFFTQGLVPAGSVSNGNGGLPGVTAVRVSG